MRALARYLVVIAQNSTRRLNEDPAENHATGRIGMLIQSLNNIPVAEHPMARVLLDAGFQAAPTGFNLRRNLPPLPAATISRPTSQQPL